jgi:membrane dipeptidase
VAEACQSGEDPRRGAWRGYTVDEIGKIWSGNALRVWSEVEEAATELKR